MLEKNVLKFISSEKFWEMYRELSMFVHNTGIVFRLVNPTRFDMEFQLLRVLLWHYLRFQAHLHGPVHIDTSLLLPGQSSGSPAINSAVNEREVCKYDLSKERSLLTRQLSQ